MRNAVCFLGTVAALAFVIGAANGATWYVHPDSALNTIQAGLDSCSSGDTVLVAAGTYYEHLVWPATQSIHLLSESGPGTTIIDGSLSGRVILIDTGVDSTTVIEELTIQRGYADFGAGIYCVGGSSPTITSNIITLNVATERGGGMRCLSNSSPTISYNDIVANVSYDRAGGIGVNSSSPRIVGNTISGNRADSDGGGGIGSGYESAPLIIGNTITGNTANNGGGGGIGCMEDSTVNATIKHNTITGNTALNGGGLGFSVSSPTVDSCVISGNSPNGVGCVLSATPSINWNTITDNTGYGVENFDSTVTVDAENNWWGDASGPGGVGPGSGDEVSNWVDYDPWLTWPPGIEEVEVPSERFFALQVGPNPFPDRTVIKWQTPDMREVALTIYDSAGRLTRQYSCSAVQSSNQVVWEGRDESGARVPAGVYFLRLEAGEREASAKLLLVR